MRARAANVEPRRFHVLTPSHLDSGLVQRLPITTDVDDRKRRGRATAETAETAGRTETAGKMHTLSGTTPAPTRHDKTRHDTTPRPAPTAVRREGSYIRLTKLLPQKRQRRTAPRSASTTQLCAAGGSHAGRSAADGCPGGRNALRVHPTHVRTIGVARMNDVMEQRAARRMHAGPTGERSMGERRGAIAHASGRGVMLCGSATRNACR